jgi:type IV pilus assembly protein PilW
MMAVMNLQWQTSGRTHFVRGSHGGFSLVELMVSVTIGLLIMAALTGLFVNVTRTNNEMSKTNSQIENGRFSMQFLQNDIIQAGFWGGYVPQYDDLTSTTIPTDVPTAVPDPCLAYASWNAAHKTNLIGIAVQSYDTLPSVCTSIITNKQANTDVLVVRHAETCVPGVGNCPADTTGKLYFQATNCSTETATPYVIDTSGYILHKKDCTTVADKRQFIATIYYIRNFAITAGDGIPTLVRSQFDLSSGTLAQQAPVALIEGVEGFRVEFGIDSLSKTAAAVDYTAAVTWNDSTNKILPLNRGDGTPDGAFVHCSGVGGCTAAQLVDVVAVNLYVLARSVETNAGYTDSKTYSLGSTTMGPFSDSYKRHVFSTSVRLTNVAGRRETP